MRDRIYIDFEDRDLYNLLIMDIKGFYNVKLSNYDLFQLALSFGFKIGCRLPLNRRNSFIRLSLIKSELYPILMAIGVEYDLNVVENLDELCTIAEEYAHAGIIYLNDFYFKSQVTFFSELLTEILKFDEDMDLDEILDKLE